MFSCLLKLSEIINRKLEATLMTCLLFDPHLKVFFPIPFNVIETAYFGFLFLYSQHLMWLSRYI